MSIITYPLNGVTYSAEDAETYLCSRSSGVFAAEDNFEISCTGKDRVVTIGTGLAWIRDGDFSGKSICSNEAVELQLQTASGSNPRYDRIVLRLDKTGTVAAGSLQVLTGTAAASPAPPAITRDSTCYELGLYTVYIPAASTVVTAAQITNTMLDETVCGVMSDGITGLPTSNLYAQWESLYTRLKTELENLDIDVIPAESVGFDDTETELGADTVQKAIEALKKQADGTQTELDDYLSNTKFTHLGTASFSSGRISGDTVFTSTDGFRDLILQYSCSYPNFVRFAINDGAAQKLVVPSFLETDHSSTGYLRLEPLGQFCRAELLPAGSSITGSTLTPSDALGLMGRLISVDSTCRLTKLELSYLRLTTAGNTSGTVKVWGR